MNYYNFIFLKGSSGGGQSAGQGGGTIILGVSNILWNNGIISSSG